MKKISIIIIAMLMLSLIAIPVMAADAVTTSLSLSGSEIKQEQEITVTVKVNGITSSGTKALSGKISFDKEVLEYQKGEFLNGWAGQFSTDGTGFAAYTNSSTSIEQVLKLTFKVKSSAKIASTTIRVNNVTLALEEGNGDPENEIQVSGSEASFKVVSSATQDQNNQNQNNQNQNNQNQNNQNQNQNNQSQKPGTSQDPTTSTNKEHPKTGLESTIVTTGIIMLILFSVVFYRKYRNIEI